MFIYFSFFSSCVLIKVASRTQKYFVRLARAGLPVPGRLPNTDNVRQSGGMEEKKKLVKIIKQDKEEEIQIVSSSMLDIEVSSNGSDEEAFLEDLSDIVRESAEYKEYRRLMRIKRRRDHEHIVQETATMPKKSSMIVHVGFICDACGLDPIVGVRYTCLICPQESPVDLCERCIQHGDFQNAIHRRDHPFERVVTQEHIDDRNHHQHPSLDYHEEAISEFRYLDPVG